MDKLNIKIEIRYATITAGILVTSAVMWLAFNLLTTSQAPPFNIFITLSGICGSGVGLTTLAYTAISINHLHSNGLAQQSRHKKEYSSKYVSSWYGPDMTANTLRLREYIKRLESARNSAE